MQTHLAARYCNTPEGRQAEAILRKCVHCGFCTATCPTYQLLGDELDGPRGRIYLIKQVLEGAAPSTTTQQHLDRCLTCRNCETTCPSGVEYGELLEIGRDLVEREVPRPLRERMTRRLLRDGLTSAAFAPAVRLGKSVARWLPTSLRNKLPQDHPGAADTYQPRQHARRLLYLAGCVQPSLAPQINLATQRVFDHAGITLLAAPQAGCCGALRLHLADQDGALEQMRANIDAWWPWIESGEVQGLVMNASGCGVTVADYGRLLARDPHYAKKARRISELTRDASTWAAELAPLWIENAGRLPLQGRRLVVQTPCTLQHGQRLPDTLIDALRLLGGDWRVASSDNAMCCGSAGTYSILQPELSRQLRDRKLAALAPQPGETVVSANIGCIQHLQSGTETPVRHWLEVLDDALGAPPIS